MNKFIDLDLISIIVPVYNVEKYVQQCLESIHRQTYRNIEVLCIDDGSTDNSGELCNQYANNDSRFSVFHEKNSGVMIARKRGIDTAHGKYITFVDPDDWVSEEYVEKLHSLLLRYNADISYCGHVLEYAHLNLHKSPKKNLKISETVISSHAALKGIIRNFNSSFWGKMYKTSLIRKVPFDHPLPAFGDIYFNIQAILNSDSFAMTNRPLYHFRKRSGGITGSLTKTVHATQGKEFIASYVQELVSRHLCDSESANSRTADIYLMTLINFSKSNSRFSEYYDKYSLWLKSHYAELRNASLCLDSRSRILLLTLRFPRLIAITTARLILLAQGLQNLRKYK